MNEQSANDVLLEFFKALADENRLKIVGLLAQKSYTVEQLASMIGLGVSTTSHHLARLAKAGLVSAKADGHYYEYSLQLNALHAMAQRLLSADELPRLSDQVDMEAYDRKVMQAFTDPSGRITSLPSQEKKLQVLLRHVLKAFEPGVRYPEKQVNEILLQFNEDTAFLRRSLVEYRYMGREGGGGAYWRIE